MLGNLDTLHFLSHFEPALLVVSYFNLDYRYLAAIHCFNGFVFFD